MAEVASASERTWSSVRDCSRSFSEAAPELMRASVSCSEGARRSSTSIVTVVCAPAWKLPCSDSALTALNTAS